MHHPEPSPLAGWLRLDAVEHVGGVADLSAGDAARFGALHAAVARAMRQTLGVDRVYSVAFGESARHLHMHLAPRSPTRDDIAGWALADVYRAVVRDPSLAATRDDVAAASGAMRSALVNELGAGV